MKLKKKQLEELKTILEGDRNKGENEFNKLFFTDLNSLLSEYFVFNNKPIVKVERIEDKIKLEIILETKEVKKFGIVP